MELKEAIEDLKAVVIKDLEKPLGHLIVLLTKILNGIERLIICVDKKLERWTK